MGNDYTDIKLKAKLDDYKTIRIMKLYNPSIKASYLQTASIPLCENCPNTEFFLVRISPHWDWIRRDTKYLSIFSPNTGKYRPEKTPYLDTFYTVTNNRTIFFSTFCCSKIKNRFCLNFRSNDLLELSKAQVWKNR